MQKIHLLMPIILSLFIGIIGIKAQPQVTSYSDLNDVYSLYFDDYVGITNDTMWIGTTVGVVYRVSTDFSVAYTITQQDDGIGSNFVTAIVVDDNGNKFFGTFEDGITVYNNGVITVYNSANSSINNKIFCLEKDVNGHIWAGTPTGAYRFDGANWDSFNTTQEAPGEIRSIAIDGDKVWFGSFGVGLHSYDVVNFTWTHETQADGNISSNQVTAIAARNDSLLVGTPGGISFFNPSGSTWITELVGAAGNEIYDIVMWDFGTFYASTANGLFSSGGSIWTLDGMLPYSPTGVLQRVNYELWIGFNENMKGVLPYMFSTPPPAHTVSGTQYPNSNSISDVISRNNETYFSTSGPRLLVFDGTQWRIEEIGDFPNLVLSDMDAQVDTIWIAAGYEGVATYDPTYLLNVMGLSDNTAEVLSVAVDKRDNKRIWCGTDKGVFSFYDFSEEALRFTQGNGQLQSDIVKKIAVNTNGEVWFLHVDGVTRYDELNTGNEFTQYTLATIGFSASTELTDIAPDNNGSVWITSTEGVVEFDGTTATNYNTSNGLFDDNVTSVHIDSRNIKFFGTLTGINTMSPFGFKRISRTDGLLTEHIKAVAFDENTGRIWSGGDWGGISATYISPISVGAYVSPSNDFYCFRGPVTLYADVNGGFGPDSYTYSWTTSDGNFTSTSPSETISPEYSTTYVLEVNDGYNSGSSSVSLDVIFSDTSIIEGPDTICPNGLPVYYSVKNDAGTIKDYMWDIFGGSYNSFDGTNSNIDVTWDTDRNVGSLFLTETDMNNCSVTQQFDVTIMTGLVPEIVLKNGGQILICTDSGYVYQWFKDDVEIPNANRQFYYLDEDLGLVNGRYYVEMNIGQDCILKSNIQLIDKILAKTYPVPAVDVLNIDFSAEDNSKGKTVIRTINGTIVEEIPFTKENKFKHLEINVSNYKSGTYLYSIILDSKKVESGKFVIN